MYIVIFCKCPADIELHWYGSRYRFKTLREARAYADRFRNAYIVREDGEGWYIKLKTRAESRI